jgi:hypothetical protein
MKFYQIYSWFKRNLSNICLPHRKMLGVFVFGILMSRRIGVAAIGRGMRTKTSAKHNIKRLARYLANDKINIEASLLALQKILYSGINRLLISIDWTVITNHGYQVLKATVAAEGRGIPIAFKTYKEGLIKNKQTIYEKELIKYLSNIIPDDIQVIIIADRGFGMKSELINYIKKVGFNYVMRTKGEYRVESKIFSGKLKDFNIIIGKIHDLKNALWPGLYHKSKSEKEKRMFSRIIITKKKGCKERWILVTDLNSMLAETIVKIYYMRMTIEETFKDEKNVLLGFALEKIKLSSAERYDKMLLILSYAYLLIMLFGLLMEQKNMHKKIMANTAKHRTLSLLQVGLYYMKKYDIPIPKILSLVGQLIIQI